MSLTTGRGPLSGDPQGWFNRPVPEGIVYVEPFHRRVRGVVGDQTVVDSERVVLVHRPGRPPTYAFPADDVGDIAAEPEPEATGYVAVPWDAVDQWLEEEEHVSGHPRNPYHRVDCIRTSRRLRVAIGGELLVDTTDTTGVYETALGPRLYVRKELVRMDLLVRSETTSYCPYKGTASYWTATVGDTVIPDLAWSYEDPYPECLPIRGQLSFYAHLADVEQAL